MTVSKKISTDSTNLTILAILANKKNVDRATIYASCGVHIDCIRFHLRSLDRKGYIEANKSDQLIAITSEGMLIWQKYCHLCAIIFD